MLLVQLESPFSSKTEEQRLQFITYGLRCLRHSLQLGEAPFASHLLYTRVLDDNKPEQRKVGMEAGLQWLRVAEAAVVYCDYGISPGMQYGIELAEKANRPIHYRNIGKNLLV